jgi:hypothetical protein
MGALFPLPTDLYTRHMKEVFTQVPVGACPAVFAPQNQAAGDVHLREPGILWRNGEKEEAGTPN